MTLLASPPAGVPPWVDRVSPSALPPSRYEQGGGDIGGAQNLMASVTWTQARGNHPPVAPARSCIDSWRGVEPSRDGVRGRKAHFLTTAAARFNRGAFSGFSPPILASLWTNQPNKQLLFF